MGKGSRAGLAVSPHRGARAAWTVVAVLLGMSAVAQTEQDAEAEPEETPSAAPLDEIIVTGEREGDQERVDPRDEEVLRARVFEEFRQIREEEEDQAFRASLPEPVERPSGVRWGYDPKDELRMRRETSLIELQQDYPKPATLVTIKF
jgi:hypothetical protein